MSITLYENGMGMNEHTGVGIFVKCSLSHAPYCLAVLILFSLHAQFSWGYNYFFL